MHGGTATGLATIDGIRNITMGFATENNGIRNGTQQSQQGKTGSATEHNKIRNRTQKDPQLNT
eukprot:7792487-Pyramimonas_sp.AAC.1